MYSNIFDSHAHYTDKAFDNDRESLLDSLKESGICGVINCGADLPSSQKSIELSEKYDFIFSACGVHPEEVLNLPENYLDIIKAMAQHEKCVAIGEIGLDYYWTKETRNKQIDVFENQIILAKELNLPIIVHDRDAHGDTLDILKKHKPKGVVHCFTGSVEMAKEVVNSGMYIGLGGVVTFKNARKAVEVAEYIPLDRLLLETDCPYMAPVPMRGKRNNSSYITYVAEKIAEIKKIHPQEVLDTTARNCQQLINN